MATFGDGLDKAVQKAFTRPAPKSAGAQMRYLVKQMKSFRDGARTNDDGVMAATVKALTDEQIDAIAQYMCSL